MSSIYVATCKNCSFESRSSISTYKSQLLWTSLKASHFTCVTRTRNHINQANCTLSFSQTVTLCEMKRKKDNWKCFLMCRLPTTSSISFASIVPRHLIETKQVKQISAQTMGKKAKKEKEKRKVFFILFFSSLIYSLCWKKRRKKCHFPLFVYFLEPSWYFVFFIVVECLFLYIFELLQKNILK